MKHTSLQTLLALALAVGAASAQAEVTLKDPWVRSTVPQQKATGFFAQLQSPTDSQLVSASSPVAGVVEVHEMAMQDNVMKMRQVPAVALPAGKPVELTPGGYHVMLMDLKQQVKVGDTVPVTLVFQDKDGKRQSMEVNAPVRALGAPGGAAQPAHKH
ncbi:MAG: copper chaperone PCu(A)C [Gammaproteobacteria bacterium]|nr:copper chaperone PCu(A)C [Gammaproteobacteria bacterium]MBU1444222.1 copper chaperone PCu(A)C [Gammaproteobacteria bacterium]MBU2286090.1 copper chaperone PCu(A)C [Gammaproteobacteria bacterium]MBU2410859.1 copper chaperone PCu(A)C [Gammaproteobacteria bacterium]